MAPSTSHVDVSDGSQTVTNGALLKGQDVVAPHEEYQYLKLIRKVLQQGEFRPDRYTIC